MFSSGARATDYFDGTTTNPLVVGPTLTNADGRIFSSDGNTTMHSYVPLNHVLTCTLFRYPPASFMNQQIFFDTCADLLSRMIDTVPRGVELTEVIEPVPVKPQSVHLVYMGDGTVRLQGEVRVSFATSFQEYMKLRLCCSYGIHEKVLVGL